LVNDEHIVGVDRNGHFFSLALKGKELIPNSFFNMREICLQLKKVNTIKNQNIIKGSTPNHKIGSLNDLDLKKERHSFYCGGLCGSIFKFTELSNIEFSILMQVQMYLESLENSLIVPLLGNSHKYFRSHGNEETTNVIDQDFIKLFELLEKDQKSELLKKIQTIQSISENDLLRLIEFI
jgi:hypothetical protein